MAADGMDKKGRNGPDSASEELFNLSQSPEDESRVDGKNPREVDPPTSQSSGPQEVVDLPNIHFGSKIDGLDAHKEQEAKSGRSKDGVDSDRAGDNDPTRLDPSRSAEGRLSDSLPEATAAPIDQNYDPSQLDGDSGLNRGKTGVRPIGPLVSSADAVPAKAEAARPGLADEVGPATGLEVAALDANGTGTTTPPTVAPPGGSAPTATDASFTIAESAAAGDPVGTVPPAIRMPATH